MQFAKYMKAKYDMDKKSSILKPLVKRTHLGIYAIICTLILLCSSIAVQAQVKIAALTDPIVYAGYKSPKTQEIWLCSSLAFPVDLSKDAFNTNYSTEFGTYDEVEPGKPTHILHSNVSAIFNVTARPAGIYEFVFTNNMDGFCGMNQADQAVVRVYLVPDLVPFSFLTSLCPKGTATVNLHDFMPFEIVNFVKEMGWKIDFKDAKNAAVVNPFNVDRRNIGVSHYSYSINDNQGTYANKYKDMKPEYKCVDFATIMHNVKVQSEVNIADQSVSFCFENIKSVYQNEDIFSLNLSSLLQVGTKEGVWSSTISEAVINPANPNQGDINIKNLAQELESGTYTFPYNVIFKYTYKNCDGTNGEALLTVVLSDKVDQIFVNNPARKDLCRNLGSGNIDLALFFGFSLPNTAGLWYDMNHPPVETLLPTGNINVDTARIGQEYNYKYVVNSAVESLCESQSEITNFKLTVRDAQMLNGTAVMCESLYEKGTTINLNNYVPGLSDNTFIDPASIEWTGLYGAGNTPVAIANPSNLEVGESKFKLAPGRNEFQFLYKSECGTSPGKFYLNLLETINTANVRTIICYTDANAVHINLFEVLGIAGLEAGQFTLVSTGHARPVIFDGNHIFNAHQSFDTSKKIETFEFVYKANQSADDCVDTDIKVSVVVTDTVLK